jgi:transcriptional regulator with XRE-family HTH domain
MSEIGGKIRHLRKMRGFSMERLGSLSNTSKSYIWDLENYPSNITVQKLEAISIALGVTPEYIMGREELSDEILHEAFFNKFKKLSKENKEKVIKIMGIIEG